MRCRTLIAVNSDGVNFVTMEFAADDGFAGVRHEGSLERVGGTWQCANHALVPAPALDVA
jgi:hypothetical protein